MVYHCFIPCRTIPAYRSSPLVHARSRVWRLTRKVHFYLMFIFSLFISLLGFIIDALLIYILYCTNFFTLFLV